MNAACQKIRGSVEILVMPLLAFLLSLTLVSTRKQSGVPPAYGRDWESFQNIT